MRRWLLPLAILVSSPSLVAQQHPYHELKFFQASELLPWCQSEARTSFAARNIPTYQWTGRYFERGNLLMVEGKIRASGHDIPVTCTAAKGARERDVVVEIGDKPHAN